LEAASLCCAIKPIQAVAIWIKVLVEEALSWRIEGILPMGTISTHQEGKIKRHRDCHDFDAAKLNTVGIFSSH
jgi:hypothetical protein